MVVDPDDAEIAARYLHPAIEVLAAALNDAWMRDIGPTFVLDERREPWRRRLGLQRLGRPGLGTLGQGLPDRRRSMPAAPAPHTSSRSLVNEGGGIQVDGEGTVLVTETVQLDPGRNPGLSQGQTWRPNWPGPSAPPTSSGSPAD